MTDRIILPLSIQHALTALQEAGYEAFVVGGCVRDALLQREPKDWDITTNALPEQIQKLFPHSLYLNAFGTVTVRVENNDIEITTYRSDGQYSDFRHPDKVEFGVSLVQDVQRRDFTINALAYDGKHIMDYVEGQADIQARLVRAVGDPVQRFQEDALRMMRAIRFSSQLGFSIESATWQAITAQVKLIQHVSAERQRDELIKMLETDDSFKAIWQLHTSGLLAYILPELEACVGVTQNLHHIYTVFFHNVIAMQFCPSDDWRVRLAALLHDVGKPAVKQGEGRLSTFYQHEHVGAKMTRQIMRRLAFPKKDIDTVSHLVRHHMFYYNVGEITDAGVRRLLQRVGLEHINDLMAVRIADRMGSGVYKEKPFKLQELEKRIAHVQQDPISTSRLVIDGIVIMEKFNLPPGPKVGVVLHRLLEDVLDNPDRNNVEYLEKQAAGYAEELRSMTDKDARALMAQYRAVLSDMNAFKG